MLKDLDLNRMPKRVIRWLAPCLVGLTALQPVLAAADEGPTQTTAASGEAARAAARKQLPKLSFIPYAEEVVIELEQEGGGSSRVASLPLSGGARKEQLYEGLIYDASLSSALRVMDLKDAAQPRLLTAIPLAQPVRSLATGSKLLFALSVDDRVLVYDVSVPSRPEYLGKSKPLTLAVAPVKTSAGSDHRDDPAVTRPPLPGPVLSEPDEQPSVQRRSTTGRKAGKVLLIVGGSMFGAFWLTPITTGASAAAPTLAIPVAGPILLGQQTGQPGFYAMGAGQILGLLTLTIGGVTMGVAGR
jgi:hypothetical protein